MLGDCCLRCVVLHRQFSGAHCAGHFDAIGGEHARADGFFQALIDGAAAVLVQHALLEKESAMQPFAFVCTRG